MDKLQIFYDNQVERELVKAWLNQCAEEWVLEQLKDDKAVDGFSTAIKIINDSFTKLDEKFGKRSVGDKTNQAK